MLWSLKILSGHFLCCGHLNLRWSVFILWSLKLRVVSFYVVVT